MIVLTGALTVVTGVLTVVLTGGIVIGLTVGADGKPGALPPERETAVGGGGRAGGCTAWEGVDN